MNARAGIALKQRVREATWKAMKDREKNSRHRYIDYITRRLQLLYKDTYVIGEPTGVIAYILVRGKCVLEVQNDVEGNRIKVYMKEQHLPGGKITINSPEEANIQWFTWYDETVFPDGDTETIDEDPHDVRTFALDDEAKSYIKAAVAKGAERKNGHHISDSVFRSIRETFQNAYKDRYINHELMPKITIQEMCVIDITHRNKGFVMAYDVHKMKGYMNEMLIPGLLINFAEGKLASYVWFGCNNSKLEMEIEIIDDMPEDLPLEIDDAVKNVIRESVIEVHKDRSITDEKSYKEAIMETLQGPFPDIHKSKFQGRQMPDLTIDDYCTIDIRKRNRGIVMTKDRHAMQSAMIELKLPAVQINFIDGSSAVILWFSCNKGNLFIALEALGESVLGANLADFI
ncbi:UNVERIFIED_CONTAM: hypothetical protein RMT77_009563 [Armadillidium vulgare]